MHALLARLMTEAWNLDARAMQGLEQLMVGAIEGRAVAAADIVTAVGCGPCMAIETGGAGGPSPGYVRAGSVGLVPVWGVLDRTDADVRDEDGNVFGTSYEAVERGMAGARSDPQVGAILQVINSPGGAARPMEEYAARLFEGAESQRALGGGGKPTFALGMDLMASAAVGLGVQADRVLSLPGTWIGSIGTRLSTFDFSALLDRAGIKVNSITSGKFKDIGSPYKPLSEEDRAKLQESVDTYANQFKMGVARGRKMTAEAVSVLATGEGWVGAAAVEKGLADRVVKSLPALVAELNTKYPARVSGGAVAARTLANGAATTAAVAANSPRGAAAVKESRMSAKQLLDAAGAAGADPTGTVIENKTPPTPVPGTLNIKEITEAATNAANLVLATERKRVADITGSAQPWAHVPEVRKIMDEAVNGTESADTFRSKLLGAVQKADPPRGGLNISIGATSEDKRRKGIEMVLMARMNPGLIQAMQSGYAGRPDLAARLASELGFESPLALVKSHQEAEGNGFRRLSLMNMAEQFVTMGSPGRTFNFRTHDDVLAASFGVGSSDMPKLFSNLAGKTLLVSFELAETTYQSWCMIGDSTDFKSEDMITLSETPDLDELPEGSRPTEGKINERAESIKQKTHGKAFSITRQAMVNDDLSGITRQLQGWGDAAARKAESLAVAQITGNGTMADGVALFHATHGNLATGAGSALSAASVEAAMTKMMVQKGFGDSTPYLNITPKILFVPSNLWGEAARIVGAEYDPTATNTNAARPNVLKGLLTPVQSPLLYADSAAKWYIFGNPSMYPVVVVKFLNGQRRPIVTQVGDGSIQGQKFEVIHDVTAQRLQWESGVRSDGA